MSDALALAKEAVATGGRALDLAWAELKARCTVDGRLSSGKLDQHQLVSYDGAFNTAELAAADFMLRYVEAARDKQGDGAELESRLGLLFAAEALQSVRARLAARLGDYGLSSAQLAETVDSSAVLAFCAEQLAAARIAETGQMVRDRHGQLGVSLLDERHELMSETFRQFATDVVMPLAEHVHREDLLIPSEILDQVTELGCFGLSIPERYGGLQDDDSEDTIGMCVVTEELSRGSLGAAGSLITRPEILARALMAGGTEEQKEYWLPKLAAGDPLGAVAVTEADYGSDVAGMRFRAARTEGGWLLNGTKSWCTFGAKAGVLLVLARTNSDLAAGHKGLSIFLVEKPSSDGHEFEHTQEGGGTISGRAIPTIGYRGMHSYDVFVDNYVVPDSALLGGEKGEGKGFYYIMAGFAGGRIQTAARAVGVMQAAFEQAVTYADERKVFGKPIGEYQMIQVKLARMAAALSACRQFSYAVAELMDQGEGAMEASMVKLFASRTAEWVAREAMQIHGGMGYAEETAVSRYFLDARVLSIFEGAEEILALKVVARGLIEQAGKD